MLEAIADLVRRMRHLNPDLQYGELLQIDFSAHLHDNGHDTHPALDALDKG